MQAATAAATACAPTKHLLAFDGSTIRAHNMRDPIGMEYVSRYRSRLSRLHNPSEGVHMCVQSVSSARTGSRSSSRARQLQAARSRGSDLTRGIFTTVPSSCPLCCKRRVQWRRRIRFDRPTSRPQHNFCRRWSLQQVCNRERTNIHLCDTQMIVPLGCEVSVTLISSHARFLLSGDVLQTLREVRLYSRRGLREHTHRERDGFR